MKHLLALTAILSSTSAMAQISFDAPFTDNAVIQRDRTIPVRGQAEPGASVTVSMNGHSKTARADSKGHWRAVLPAQEAGGPYRLSARSKNSEATLDNIMLGDVWLCSGQSNMEFTLRQVSNADFEVQQAKHPNLRLFNVPRQTSGTPKETLAAPTSWQVTTPQSATNFSAACYFMGRDLQTHQGIPVGLIAASWGGSPIEEWISADALGTLPRYREQLARLKQYEAAPDRGLAAWREQMISWLGDRLMPPATASWQKIDQLLLWEDWSGPLSNFDGIGYYRAHVTLTADQAREAELLIGSVDDMDATRVNGQIVGMQQGWTSVRRYKVPAGMLREGDNIIDVTAIDTGGGGGLWGENEPALTFADGTRIPLKQWRFAVGTPMNQMTAPPSLPGIGGGGGTTMFNGMIAPLGGYPLKGFAWYQGEANVGDPDGYAQLMPLLVSDWRKRFGANPFIMVQLAGFGALSSTPVDRPWGAHLRDVQRRVADADPGIGMASALDIGQTDDIHPTNKKTVGQRLALAARKIALGEAVEDRGPSPVTAVRTNNGISIRFAHGPLKLAGGGEALGFELCDEQAKCRFVPGRKTSDDTILLPNDVSARKVRYLWQESPLVNIYNQSGLPASGFELPITSNADSGK